MRIAPADVPRTAAILRAIPPAHVARRQRLLGAVAPFVTIRAFEFHAVLWELVQLACRAGVCRALPRAGVWPPGPLRAALTSAPAGALRHICGGDRSRVAFGGGCAWHWPGVRRAQHRRPC